MGFFKDMLRKSQGLPTESEVSSALLGLRKNISSVQLLADGLDAANPSTDDLSLGMALRFDLLNFSLHIAASDGVLEQGEVDAINAFLGSDLSHSDAMAAIEQLGLGSASFNREIPISFRILTEMSKFADVSPRDFAESLISTYKALGSVIALSDGDVAQCEKDDLDRYISMLERYARTF